MSSAARSRWAADDPDDAEADVQRRREKEARKLAKAEKQRQLTEAEKSRAQRAQAANSPTDQSNGINGNQERPSKRRRTSPDTAVDKNGVEAGSKLLQFPMSHWAPCHGVDDYDKLNDIEEGSYGWVSRAKNTSTGEVVALKKLKMDNANDGFPVTGLREVQTLMASRHPNVVHLREVVKGSGPTDIYLVMDFLEHDLKTLLEDMAEPFLPSETKTLMLQIVSATAYLHSHWILHRDLKTSNLLMNNRGEIKLADFGMARYTGNPPPKLTQLVVTLWYRAPELLLGTTEYGFEIDLWSIGCIFGELLTREPLFQGKNEVDQLSKIFALVGTPTNTSWPNFRNLPNAKALHPVLSKIRPSTQGPPASRFPYLSNSGLKLLSSLISLNPAVRPTAAEVLSNLYFSEDPRPKAKEMFPTFPSKAGQEKRRRRTTPQAPVRGQAAAKMGEEDFAGLFSGRDGEEAGGGFALRLG